MSKKRYAPEEIAGVLRGAAFRPLQGKSSVQSAMKKGSARRSIIAARRVQRDLSDDRYNQ